LTIAAHTGDGAAALEQLQLLRAEGVAAGAFVWAHAQNEHDGARHARAAEGGRGSSSTAAPPARLGGTSSGCRG